MKTVPKNVKKAFALSSLIGAALMSSKNGDPKLHALHIQINRAMQVFNIKAGNGMYWEISNKVYEIWSKLAVTHNTMLTDDEVSVMVEYMCMLIPPKDFYEFLKVDPYVSFMAIRQDRFVSVCHSVLDLDKSLNELFGTKAYTMVKPKQKIVKEKKKKEKSKRIETRRAKAEKREEGRSTRIRSFLGDRIAKAREHQHVQ